jgi:DNA-binding response OmpR family regulator
MTGAQRVIEVVVVEDEADIRLEVVAYLNRRGFHARPAGSGAELDQRLSERTADVVVLDLGLPGEDGVAVAARLRRDNGHVGIIMLTARSRAHERVLGYDIGADVYLVKPVDFAELEAAIRSLTRRLAVTEAPKHMSAAPVATAQPAAARAAPDDAEGAWTLDVEAWSLTTPDGVVIRLTRAEMDLMGLLADTPGQPVARTQIASAMGKSAQGGDHRYIDKVASRLRRKLADTWSDEPPIQAAHSKGYLFAAPLHRVD